MHSYLEYSFNSILNIFYRSGYSALDPEFSKNRIHAPGVIKWASYISKPKNTFAIYWV